MSSCCLAACGRLAENSQSGEAGFNSLWTGSPGTSAPSAAAAARGAQPRRGAGVLAREGVPWAGCSGDFLSSASPRQLCPRHGVQREEASRPQPPLCPPEPFHPLTSVRPRGPGTGRSFPLDQRLQDRTKGPVSLSHVVFFFPFPLLWTCVLFPTLPKIVAVKA